MSNLELNVDVLEQNAAADLAAWFEQLWNDRFSFPVTEDLLALLEESWANPKPRRPYEVFLKVCYDLSRDVREGLAEYSVPPIIGEQLLEFQATAVKTLARRVMSRSGTMLGDVVGLGKTLTAIAVALMLRDEHGFHPLIVCPKNLVWMWERYLEAYDLHGRVVPFSTAHTDLEALRRYPLVIVDESHTLRHSTRRDYAAVHDYIRRNDSKVLLLTATPYNIDYADVANQLGLYLDEDADLGVSPTNALSADPTLRDKVDQKVTTLAAFRKSEDPDDWKRLMSEHLVRRTRSFIRRNYSKTDAATGRDYLEFPDGSRFTFPERRVHEITHSFGDEDPAALMSSNHTLDAIAKLRLPRYDLGFYLARGVAYTPGERQFVDDIARARGQVAGFVRTLFYKRLTSSGYSFLATLRRHVERNELFLYALANDLPIPAGTFVDTSLTADETADPEGVVTGSGDVAIRYQALVQANPSGVSWVRAALFTSKLTDDLAVDTAVLRNLMDEFGEWDRLRDSKLQALADLLTKHPDEKILIFTEYKDTATYVAAALTAAGFEDVGLVTGDTDNPTDIARRFSPRSNRLPGHETEGAAEELRVLVATDVLSEGQNLQDASVIANYDLPWAIIRLIQRAGRVDRIGQQSDTVDLYSFTHESLSNVIDLRQRIARRLKENAATFGSDERFFGTDDEVSLIHDLYAGKLEEEDEDLDAVDAASLAYQYWKQVEDTDPGLAKRIAGMPDLVDATRQARITDLDGGVACYVRTESDLDGFAFATLDGQLRPLTGHEALRVFEATPDEPGRELVDGHDDLVRALVRGPLATPGTVAGRLRGVRLRIWRRLGQQQTLDVSADLAAALEDLFAHPLTAEAERRLRSALAAHVSDEDLGTRIVALHRDGQLVTTRTGNDPVRIVSTMGVRT
jgi:superfamily II DNA or RNA helicase